MMIVSRAKPMALDRRLASYGKVSARMTGPQAKRARQKLTRAQRLAGQAPSAAPAVTAGQPDWDPHGWKLGRTQLAPGTRVTLAPQVEAAFKTSGAERRIAAMFRQAMPRRWRTSPATRWAPARRERRSRG